MDELFERICDYEAGELVQKEVIELFQDLLDEGLLNELQGSYERTAARLIEAGLIFVDEGDE